MEELKAKWTFDQGGFAKAMIVPTPMGPDTICTW